jgi:hypothetical protein
LIRILNLAGGRTPAYRVEGRAVGPSGTELTRFVEASLLEHSVIILDLECLLSVDQPTMEYLALHRDRVMLERAPRYLNQWLEGIGHGSEGNTPGAPAPGTGR